MQVNQGTQPESIADAENARHQTTGEPKCTGLSSRDRKPILSKSSTESTAPTLLSYSEQSGQPSKYNDAGIYARYSHPSAHSKPRANPQYQPVSASAVNAVMATSSSSTDKMHSQRSSSRKVDDWNEDPTYKSKLASMVGSTRKWNYFGADIGGNPFRRSGGRKK